MNATDFSTLVPWVIAHGYLIFLIAALIEGPFISAAGGVAAALGFYNIYIIMALSILGDFGGDFFYYGLGFIFNKPIANGRLRFLGINSQRVEKIRNLLHERISRAVLLIKMTPIIGPAGILILGAIKAPFKKFLKAAFIIAIPKSLFFVLLGYYSGAAYIYLDKTIAKSETAVTIVAAIFIVIYFIYKKITSNIAKKYE